MFNRIAIIAALLSLLFVGSSLAGQSPFSRGNLVIGGGGTYQSFSPDEGLGDENLGDENLNIVLISPTLGYFVSSRMCAGVTLMLGRLSYGDMDVSASAIGPKLTYYLAKQSQLENYSGRAVPYLTASALIGTISEGGADLDFRSFSLGAGAIAMFAKNIGGYCEVNYNFDHFKTIEPAASVWDTEDEIVYDGKRLGVELGLRLFIW